MNNLYVIAIGGSGERVLKSLVMLLSAGVPVGANRIIPVIVDNDEKSRALTECKRLIEYYNADPTKVQKMGANTCYKYLSEASNDWGSFFKTIIESPITLNQAGRNIGNLQTVIGTVDDDSVYTKSIGEELNLLFSQDDLTMPLNVGFVGNPNIGSVVLNSLSLADPNFEAIKTQMTSNDGVIVIGSLFGGTGAAGVPLIINTINAFDAARRPILGAVTLLPYFTFGAEDKCPDAIINTKKWDVDSDTFDTKTRAALMYYDTYMCGINSLDYMYYVGDDYKDSYDHFVGGHAQKNPTHIVELMSALSIIDFSKQHQSGDIVYKRPNIRVNEADGSLNVTSLLNKEQKKALIKFQMLKEMFTNDKFLKEAIEQRNSAVANIRFTHAIRNAVINDYTQFAHCYGINHLFKEWDEWLKELGRSTAKRRFSLFNHSNSTDVDNILSNFYSSDSKYGMAKTESYKKTIFCKSELRVVKAEVLDALHDAYRRGNYTLDNDDRKILPLLLKVISDALDKVIEEKCVEL